MIGCAAVFQFNDGNGTINRSVTEMCEAADFKVEETFRI